MKACTSIHSVSRPWPGLCRHVYRETEIFAIKHQLAKFVPAKISSSKISCW